MKPAATLIVIFADLAMAAGEHRGEGDQPEPGLRRGRSRGGRRRGWRAFRRVPSRARSPFAMWPGAGVNHQLVNHVTGTREDLPRLVFSLSADHAAPAGQNRTARRAGSHRPGPSIPSIQMVPLPPASVSAVVVAW